MREFFLKLRHNKQLLGFAVAFSLLFVVGAIGAGIFYFYQFSQQVMIKIAPASDFNNPVPIEEVETEEEANEITVVGDALARVAEKNSALYVVSTSTESYRSYAFSIKTLNTIAGDEHLIAEFKTGSYMSGFELNKQKLFYLQNGNLQSLDLASPIPSTLIASTTSFLIADRRIWYITDESLIMGPHAIGYFDLDSYQPHVIFENIGQVLGEYSAPGGFALFSYDPTENSLIFYTEYGDAGCGSISVYKLMISTKKISKVDEAGLCTCGDPIGPGEAVCPPDQQVKENKFNAVRQLVAKKQVCNNVDFTRNFQNGNLEFVIADKHRSLADASYIGCIE